MDSIEDVYVQSFTEESETAGFSRIVVPSFAKSVRCPSRHAHTLSIQMVNETAASRISALHYCSNLVTGSTRSVSRRSDIEPNKLKKNCSDFCQCDVADENVLFSARPSVCLCSESQSAGHTADMQNMKLTTIPPTIFQSTNLLSLRLDHNHIRCVPPTISLLSQLEFLSLSHNDIRTLDRGLGRLQQLKVLVLDHNAIEEWPEWVCGELTQLRLLYLHGNPGIAAIPLSFAGMAQLERLSFDWFMYAQPELGPILKGDAAKTYIEQLRTLCGHSLSPSRKPGKKHSDPHVCRFFQFFRTLVLKKRLKLGQALQLYPKKRSALHLACQHGHTVVVKALLEAGHTPNCLDEEGFSPLLLAVMDNRIDCAKLLLANPATQVNLYSSSNKKYPLHTAIRNGRYDLAELIADHPTVDVMAKDADGNTALHLLFGRFDCYPLLVQKVCLAIVNNPGCNVNEKNAALLTPLHVAAISQQRFAIKFAAAHNDVHGQNLEFVPNRVFNFAAEGGNNRFSVLHNISLYADPETVCAVLRANVDVFAKDCYGRTARDVINDALVGKLLLRKEQRILRTTLQQRREEDCNSDDESCVCPFSAGEKTQTVSPVLGPVQTWGRRSEIVGRSNVPIAVADEDVATHLAVYRSDPPTMFEELRRIGSVCTRRTVGGSRLGASKGLGFNLHSRSFNFIGQHPPTELVKCAEKICVETEEDDCGDAIELDATIKCTDLFDSKERNQICDDFSIAEEDVEEERAEDPSSLTHSPTVEDRLISHNKYSRLYKQLVKKGTPQYTRLRILYRIFRDQTNDSGEILSLLNKRLGNSDPLKLEVVHLLGMLGKDFSGMEKETKVPAAVRVEAANAGGGAISQMETMMVTQVCSRQLWAPKYCNSVLMMPKSTVSQCEARSRNYALKKRSLAGPPKQPLGKDREINVPQFRAKNVKRYFREECKKC